MHRCLGFSREEFQRKDCLHARGLKPSKRSQAYNVEKNSIYFPNFLIVANTHSYLLSRIVFPRKVQLKLEKVQGEFLWRSGPSDSKIHIINGNVVFSKSVENGWQLEPLNVEQGID